MSKLIQIRDVPDEVHEPLRARAAARGESLNTYMRRMVVREAEERPTLDEVLERIQARRPLIAAMRAFEAVEDRLELWPLLEIMTADAIALREDVSSYDATYVSLARILPCPLVTADARLNRAVGGLIDVILV